ncbi:MAG: hypothetical protein KDD10_11095 [Phaeodactylibacter sp.]|nr:hypothetical protein [Phaeodactylibacter sp.]MCB9297263.1 CcoQ/FixQ family Cbb3-type cytochrome c oxidase assembly chaperone [Lewinellaceae bacterium]MCO6487015.1 hypothetical protein [Phaeodactylibacter sp.]
MFKYILENAGNINWMAISALLTFMVIFMVSVALVFKHNPAYINRMASMPLDDSNPVNSEIDNHEK